MIVWASDRSPPTRWPQLGVDLRIVQAHPGLSSRFHPHPAIATPAVLSLDEDTVLNTDEIDFAFNVWMSFPDRIVGYPARSHYWDESKVC